MKYLIVKAEESTTSTGKPMWKATLKGDDGVDTTINMFDKVGEGMTLDGEIYINDKGYKNFKSAQKAAASSYATNQKGAQIEQAQERKAEYIRVAQDRKEESIAYFNSLNAAISFVSTKGSLDIEHAYTMVMQYRDKFFDEWKKWSEKAF